MYRFACLCSSFFITKSFQVKSIIAAKGIAKRIPPTPNNLPPKIMAISIISADTPRLPPKSLGLMTYPSNVYKTTVNMRNHNAYQGSTSTSINAPNKAPTIGPKVGARFVTPTITEIRAA